QRSLLLSARLFPYTTLFRSQCAVGPQLRLICIFRIDVKVREVAIRERKLRPRGQLLQDADRLLCRLERLGTATDVSEKSRKRPRSEEHTSELQSRSDLVCRL